MSPVTRQRCDDGEIISLYRRGIDIELRLQTHHIDLQSIRPSLSDTLSELRPASCSRAVNTGNDGHRESLLRLTNQLQVVLNSLGSHVRSDILIRLGVIVLGNQMLRVHHDLLFKKRLQDDGTSTRLSISYSVINIARQPRAADDERALQRESSEGGL